MCAQYSALKHNTSPLRIGIDLADFAIPIDNLQEPGMAAGLLIRLDQYLVDTLGAGLVSQFQYLIEIYTTRT